MMLYFFFFKQKTAYEMRISDWSSDVCSSDLMDVTWHLIGHLQSNKARKAAERCGWIHAVDSVDLLRRLDGAAAAAARTLEVLIQEIGRASCRERVCQYV